MAFRVILPAVLAGLVAHACTLDFDQYRDPASTGGSAPGAGGATTTGGGSVSSGGAGGPSGGMGGVGGMNAGGGGGDLSDLGTACESNAECDIGECCDDNACDKTCMVPCKNESDCPLDTMGCIHGYCLFPCAVDGDCEHAGFVCHHNCEWCEKKDTQDCN